MAVWKDIVRTVAPGLATALGGPLAGVAVKALGDKLLGKPDASEEEVGIAVQALAPADYVKLREAEQQFAIDMKRVDIDIFKLEVDDRTSARGNRGWAVWAPQIALAILYHGIFSFVFYLLFFRANTEFSDFQKAALTQLMGALSAGLTMILSFYFGGMYKAAESTPPKEQK